MAVTANDADGDEVPDAFDTCPAVPNVDQSPAACRASEEACGNGHVDLGEECDDGNRRDGDACSSACTLCNPRPRDDCRAALPGRSELAWSTRATTEDAVLDRLTWTWRSESPLPLAELGNPLVTARYALCVYDAATAGSPPLALAAPAGSRCLNGPCWRPTGANGFVYHDARVFNDGIARAELNTPERRAARLLVDAKGPRLHAAAVPAGALTVQLTNGETDTCWTAHFTSARRRDERRSTAVND